MRQEACAIDNLFSTCREYIEWLPVGHFWDITTSCHRSNGAEFQILLYLCPVLRTWEERLSWFCSTKIINSSQFIQIWKVKTTSTSCTKGCRNTGRDKDLLRTPPIGCSSQCVRTVNQAILEKTICGQCGSEVHEEVEYGAMTWMDKVGLVLEQFVDAFNDVTLAQHHLVPQGHELGFHIQPRGQGRSLSWTGSRRSPTWCRPVGKQLAVESLSEHLPHLGSSAVHYPYPELMISFEARIKTKRWW